MSMAVTAAIPAIRAMQIKIKTVSRPRRIGRFFFDFGLFKTGSFQNIV